MPHVTQAYPFEGKVLQFANKLSMWLTGEVRSFLLVFDGNGAGRTLHFELPEPSWHDLVQRLEAAGDAYLFYDPFDAPENTWLSWHAIERATMERLIGERFEDSDFRKKRTAASRAPSLEPPLDYPVTWGVMF